MCAWSVHHMHAHKDVCRNVHPAHKDHHPAHKDVCMMCAKVFILHTKMYAWCVQKCSSCTQRCMHYVCRSAHSAHKDVCAHLHISASGHTFCMHADPAHIHAVQWEILHRLLCAWRLRTHCCTLVAYVQFWPGLTFTFTFTFLYIWLPKTWKYKQLWKPRKWN